MNRPSDPCRAELQRLVRKREEATRSGLLTSGIPSGMFIEQVEELTARIDQLPAELGTGTAEP